MIDSHAHLCYPDIKNDLDEKLRLAKLAGVSHILTISTNISSMTENIEIANKYDNIFSSIGIHPSYFEDNYDLDEMIEMSKNEKVIGIGEIGLDYHYFEEAPKESQLNLLKDMLSLSNSIDLPYIFHSRECFEDIFNILSEYPIKSGVFHCYTDNLENAKKILDLGFYISFSGIVTFKNSDDLRSIAKYVPDDRFLIETDCPYLTPVPYRGKVNEPAFVSLVAECIADVRKTTISKISEITTQNFFQLFSKAKSFMEMKK